MKVYAVETSNIEGQSCIHDIYSSYDAALEAVKKYMKDYNDYGDCWKPYKNLSGWWFYGCDSIGIEEYEVKDKPEGK